MKAKRDRFWKRNICHSYIAIAPVTQPRIPFCFFAPIVTLGG